MFLQTLDLLYLIYFPSFFTAAPPGSPEDLQYLNLDQKSVTLQWRKPKNDGGAPITAYIIEKREGKGGSWRKIDDTDSATQFCVIEELLEGFEYYFRVCAKNSGGLGEPAEMKTPVVPTKQKGAC